MNTNGPDERRTFALALAAALVVAACGDDDDDATDASTEDTSAATDGGGSGEKVTLTVSNLPPTTEQETRDAFLVRVEEFEAANPDIDIEPSEYEWDVATFAAQMAGGTLPTVFQIPFPDARGLVERGQVADITEQVQTLPYADQFNPNVLAVAAGRRGAHLRHPVRRLRHRPALQPSDVRAGRARSRRAADNLGAGPRVRQADRRRHRAGRLRPAVAGQHGRLDAHRADVRQRRAHAGGHRRRGRGDDRQRGHASRRWSSCKSMRWEDNSMGSNFLFEWGTINQAFAAGQVGMYMSGSDVYNSLVTENEVDPASYGLTILPARR